MFLDRSVQLGLGCFGASEGFLVGQPLPGVAGSPFSAVLGIMVTPELTRNCVNNKKGVDVEVRVEVLIQGSCWGWWALLGT